MAGKKKKKQLTHKPLRMERARAELAIQVIKLVDSFESKEEPKIKLTKHDKQLVLMGILHKSMYQKGINSK